MKNPIVEIVKYSIKNDVSFSREELTRLGFFSRKNVARTWDLIMATGHEASPYYSEFKEYVTSNFTSINDETVLLSFAEHVIPSTTTATHLFRVISNDSYISEQTLKRFAPYLLSQISNASDLSKRKNRSLLRVIIEQNMGLELIDLATYITTLTDDNVMGNQLEFFINELPRIVEVQKEMRGVLLDQAIYKLKSELNRSWDFNSFSTFSIEKRLQIIAKLMSSSTLDGLFFINLPSNLEEKWIKLVKELLEKELRAGFAQSPSTDTGALLDTPQGEKMIETMKQMFLYERINGDVNRKTNLDLLLKTALKVFLSASPSEKEVQTLLSYTLEVLSALVPSPFFGTHPTKPSSSPAFNCRNVKCEALLEFLAYVLINLDSEEVREEIAIWSHRAVGNGGIPISSEVERFLYRVLRQYSKTLLWLKEKLQRILDRTIRRLPRELDESINTEGEYREYEDFLLYTSQFKDNEISLRSYTLYALICPQFYRDRSFIATLMQRSLLGYFTKQAVMNWALLHLPVHARAHYLLHFTFFTNVFAYYSPNSDVLHNLKETFQYLAKFRHRDFVVRYLVLRFPWYLPPGTFTISDVRALSGDSLFSTSSHEGTMKGVIENVLGGESRDDQDQDPDNALLRQIVDMLSTDSEIFHVVLPFVKERFAKEEILDLLQSRKFERVIDRIDEPSSLVYPVTKLFDRFSSEELLDLLDFFDVVTASRRGKRIRGFWFEVIRQLEDRHGIRIKAR